MKIVITGSESERELLLSVRQKIQKALAADSMLANTEICTPVKDILLPYMVSQLDKELIDKVIHTYNEHQSPEDSKRVEAANLLRKGMREKYGVVLGIGTTFELFQELIK